MNSQFSVGMHLAITEAKSSLVATDSLEDQLRAAMQVTRNHWMCTDEDEQFRAAIGAVMLHYGEESEEYKRLSSEMAKLRKVNAFLQAAQAGLSVDLSLLPDEDNQYEPIGLLGMWKSIQ